MKRLTFSTLLAGVFGSAFAAALVTPTLAGPAAPAPAAVNATSDLHRAQWGGPPHRGPKGGPAGGWPIMRMAREADTNNDRALSQEEIDAYVAVLVQRGDANGDGNLSIDEFETVWLSLMRPQMVDRFQDLDEDGDGVVTEAERTERFGGIVEMLDRNDDGQLSRADRPRHKHGEHGKRGDREDREERRADRRDESPEERAERREQREERREMRERDRAERQAAEDEAPAAADEPAN